MSNESVVVVVLRVAGFFIGVTTLWQLIQAALSVPILSSAGFEFWSVWLLFGGIALLFSWLLIRFPRLVTRSLLARKEAEEQATAWTLDEFQTVAFAVLGLFFIGISLSGLTGTVILLGFLLHDMSGLSPDVYLADLAADLFGLGFGLWLLFGGKGLKGLLRAARRAG